MKFTREQLHGMWSALPTPWKRDGKLDRKTYVGDITRVCRAGVHGVYSGGTTGEFYAQDFKLFCEINELLIDTAHANRTPVQAGCTALDTAQARQRVRWACRQGADVIQIALPFWLELDDAEVVDFYRAIADEAGATPIVHYDTMRAKRRIAPDLFVKIYARVPTLWGVKLTGDDLFTVRRITWALPNFRVFVSEHILASATPQGATGCYSALVNTNPAWMLEYYEACRQGDWERAFRIQEQAARLIGAVLGGAVTTPHLQDSALDRLLGKLGGFLQCPLEGKPPYRSGTREDLRRLRTWARKNVPEILSNDCADMV